MDAMQAVARAARRLPWLGLLAACYEAVDASVAQAIAGVAKPVACGPGCVACCSHPIPVTPLEVAGLGWYARECMPPPVRRALTSTTAEGTVSCRFLRHGVCSVYALRPVACRRYIVFGIPCTLGEDPTQTRPHDLLWPPARDLEAAFALTLPYYAALDEIPAPDESPRAFMARRTVILASLPSLL